MNDLALRKRLLVAESDLNRIQRVMARDALSSRLHHLTSSDMSLDSIASSLALLVTGVAAFQRGKREDTGAAPSRVELLLNGVVLLSTLWVVFRKPPGNPPSV